MSIIKHSSLRLRGLRQPGDIDTADLGGSGGVTYGAILNRTNESGMAAALAAGTPIPAADPTKGRQVIVATSNATGSTKVPYIDDYDTGLLVSQVPAPDGTIVTLELLLGPGEQFMFHSAGGCAVDYFTERAIS